MVPIRVRPAALADLTHAWRWYESQREGLGDEFLGDEFRACIDVAMAEIARAPLAWRTVHGSVRRRIVRDSRMQSSSSPRPITSRSSQCSLLARPK